MTSFVDVHRQGRQRVGALVGALGSEHLRAMVPACPHWSVHDTVAHLTGLAVDFQGDLQVVLTPAYWDHDEVDRRQIQPRRAITTGDVLAEWDAASPAFEQVLSTADPALAGAIVGEYIVHYHDLATALSRPPARDDEAVRTGLDIYVGTLSRRIASAGLPPLGLETELGTWTAGHGTPEAMVEGKAFDLLRALSGRRTHDQVAAFHWTGDPSVHLPVFSMYEWPDAPLPE